MNQSATIAASPDSVLTSCIQNAWRRWLGWSGVE